MDELIELHRQQLDAVRRSLLVVDSGIAELAKTDFDGANNLATAKGMKQFGFGDIDVGFPIALGDRPDGWRLRCGLGLETPSRRSSSEDTIAERATELMASDPEVTALIASKGRHVAFNAAIDKAEAELLPTPDSRPSSAAEHDADGQRVLARATDLLSTDDELKELEASEGRSVALDAAIDRAEQEAESHR